MIILKFRIHNVSKPADEVRLQCTNIIIPSLGGTVELEESCCDDPALAGPYRVVSMTGIKYSCSESCSQVVEEDDVYTTTSTVVIGLVKLEREES